VSKRRYTIYDAANAGTSLSVEEGGQVVTTSAGALNINRMVRGTLGVTGYTHYAEFIIYGDAASIANMVSIGVASGSASLSTYVGAEELSIGYRVGEGQIRRGGSSLASVSVGVKGDVIGVLVDHQDATTTIAWYKNGTLLETVTLDGGSPLDVLFGEELFFAVSLGSTAEADLKVRVKAGLDAFEYPNSLSDGWWTVRPMPAAVRISDEPFLSTPSDQPANTRWKGCITAAGFQVTRRMQVWPWGDGNAASGSAIALTFTDPDHELDRLLSGLYRDEAITLHTTDTNLADAETLGELTFERCEVMDDLKKRLIGRDILARMESARTQRRNFRPDATGGAANRPWPLCLGACFSVPVVLFDEDLYRYAIDSIGVEQVGHVRDAGVIVASTGSPLGYALEAGGQALDLTEQPTGVVTADVAVTGSAYTPEAPVDALGGSGSPFDGTPGSTITGWTGFRLDGSSLPDTTPYYHGSGRVAFPQEYGARTYIQHNSVQLTGGTRYRFQFTVNQMTQTDGGGSAAIVGLTYIDGQFGAYFSVNSNVFYQDNPSGLARTYSGTFTAPITHYAQVFYTGNSFTGGTDCHISALTFIELPPIDDTEEDDAVEDAIAAFALPLEDMLRAIIEERGGFSSTVWDSATAAAIDTATGYTGSGFHATAQAQVRDAVEEVLDGYTASIFPGRDGVLRVARLIAPENVATENRYGELRMTRMLSELIPRRDDAPGLTRSMGARQNELVLSDADLQTNDPDVTLRLRRKLARTHRFVVTTGVPFAAGYEHAEVAEYVGTRLVMAADAQAEMDRVGEIYAYERSFYEVECIYLDDLEVGDVLTVYYDWYGFSEGVALLVVGIEEDRINRTMRLTLWGLAPEEL
jgi:hypothetical protein